MNKRIAASMLCLFTGSLWAGGFNASSKGTTAAGFLKVGVGARASSLGEAYAALADDAGALYWNPAGLARMGARSAMLMRASYLDAGSFDYGAYGQSFGKRNAWGLSVQRASAGDVTRRDENGNPMGSFAPQDTAVSLGYAHGFSALSVGVSGKLIRSTLLDTSQTAAVDAGVLSNPLMGGNLSLAAVVTNLGGKINYGDMAQSLPMAFRVGSAYKVLDQWTASLDLGFPRDNAPYAALGTEVSMPVGSWSFLWRAGYNSQAADASGAGASGFSFGFGVGLKGMGIDYSSVPMGSLGVSHRFSLTYKF